MHFCEFNCVKHIVIIIIYSYNSSGSTVITPNTGNNTIKSISYTWLAIAAEHGENADFLAKRLNTHEGVEWKPYENFVALNLGESWAESWPMAYASLNSVKSADLRVALTTSLNPPSIGEIRANSKSLDEIENFAQSQWLLNYLENNMIMCHYQSVVDKNSKIFGWESFARIMKDDGEIISGHTIIKASRALNIRHVIDRHLQVLAVRDFMNFELGGVLFINFMPDFIQKPEKYLEGLEAEARKQSLLTRRIVLEFPIGLKMSNNVDIGRVVSFCRERGYLISLDDVTDFGDCASLIPSIKPDFVKLDGHATTKGNLNTTTLPKLIKAAHANNCSVLAEGVENEDTFKTLAGFGVDFFQGYYFSKPGSPLKPE